jgi:hypothetical protein
MVGSCERSYDSLGSIKFLEFLEFLMHGVRIMALIIN